MALALEEINSDISLRIRHEFDHGEERPQQTRGGAFYNIPGTGITFDGRKHPHISMTLKCVLLPSVHEWRQGFETQVELLL